jgi:hypothetical protein
MGSSRAGYLLGMEFEAKQLPAIRRDLDCRATGLKKGSRASPEDFSQDCVL